ncbi:MAG TPA: hypothetical protein PK228_20160 [Saprospiraceae bacterium]|nr:hypothetical protein [Saprospiraceae bacterium]
MARPAELTDEKVRELTEKFRADKSQRVWNEGFITKALLDMSSGKCCYCECNIAEESKYMEVEHFHPKNPYEDEVVVWENLLPSCKRCNGNKSDHDTVNEPIIHPVNDDPREHLEFKAYRFYGKTSIGKMTIEIVKLNERQRLQLKRWEIGSKTVEELNELEERVRDFLAGNHTLQKRRNMVSKLRGIMEQGQPNKEYSATVATEILREDSYHFAKTELSKLGLWDADFQHLEDELTKIAF